MTRPVQLGSLTLHLYAFPPCLNPSTPSLTQVETLMVYQEKIDAISSLETDLVLTRHAAAAASPALFGLHSPHGAFSPQLGLGSGGLAALLREGAQIGQLEETQVKLANWLREVNPGYEAMGEDRRRLVRQYQRLEEQLVSRHMYAEGLSVARESVCVCKPRLGVALALTLGLGMGLGQVPRARQRSGKGAGRRAQGHRDSHSRGEDGRPSEVSPHPLPSLARASRPFARYGELIDPDLES